MVDVDLLIAAISSFAAAAGLIYSGLQYKTSVDTYRQTVRTGHFSTLKSFADEIEKLEKDPERKTKMEIFVVQYLNFFDRFAYIGLKNLIEKDVVRYFEENFGAALGFLEMDEFKQYSVYGNYLKEWCSIESIDPRPPQLPAPNIKIKRVPSKGKAIISNFIPNEYCVEKGKFVIWKNFDDRPHSVEYVPESETDSYEFKSKPTGPLALTDNEGVYAHKFEQVRVYRYKCGFHPGEEGTIRVVDTQKECGPSEGGEGIF